MNKEDLWGATLAQVQLNISTANFNTWFKNTEISLLEDNEIEISVPNTFVKEWLENKYHKLIFKIIHDLYKDAKEIRYIVDRKNPKPTKKNSSSVSINKINSTNINTDQLDFQELRADKETNLNPRYTFETFIIGPFNELPHAAAKAVVQSPGSVYNPLFIYGGVGLGKTHLLQAMGNEIANNASNKKVKYISAEKFISEVVSSIRNHNMEEFKAKYREIDVLIIDDIQFLSGKEKTQEEFFHTFNVLYESNKQIVISSDRPPKSIQALAERLRSRFEGGMIADISYPDLETRLAILKSKAQEKEISLSDDVYYYLANNIQKNIRELEGALNKLAVHQKITNQTIDLELTKSLLKNILHSPAKRITPKKIIKAVSQFYDLKERDILASSRKKEIVKPRQVAMYLLRKELQCSFPFIGRQFGGKDHTTAIHSCDKISKEIEGNESTKEELILIKQLLIEQI